MHEIDQPEFDRAFGRLCAGFDTPPTQVRKDAYWQGLRKHTITQFERLIDLALTESKMESMPTVGALRKLLDERAGQSRAQTVAQEGPSVQAQLCGYVLLSRFPVGTDSKFSPDQMRQTSLPWTYLYREWIDDQRHRAAECTGVLIPAYGALAGFRVTVADMLGDPLHQQVLDHLARHEVSA